MRQLERLQIILERDWPIKTIPALVISEEEKSSNPCSETTPETALYIASDLETWETEYHYLVRNVKIDGKFFRRLDAEFYRWLRYEMMLADDAAESGRLTTAEFNELLVRFNEIHVWAVNRFGGENLTFFFYPKMGGLLHIKGVSSTDLAKVDAIRDRAFSLGWGEERIYQNRGRFPFPLGQYYGLICSLDGVREVGQITRQYIEIIGPAPFYCLTHFYNPDVAQPWIKRVGYPESGK